MINVASMLAHSTKEQWMELLGLVLAFLKGELFVMKRRHNISASTQIITIVLSCMPDFFDLFCLQDVACFWLSLHYYASNTQSFSVAGSCLHFGISHPVWLGRAVGHPDDSVWLLSEDVAFQGICLHRASMPYFTALRFRSFSITHIFDRKICICRSHFQDSNRKNDDSFSSQFLGDCEKGGKLITSLISFGFFGAIAAAAAVIKRGILEYEERMGSRMKVRTVCCCFVSALLFVIAFMYWAAGCYRSKAVFLSKQGIHEAMKFGPAFGLTCACAVCCIIAGALQLRGSTTKYRAARQAPRKDDDFSSIEVESSA